MEYKESLEIKIASSAHARNDLLFLKHFKTCYDTVYTMYDIHKSVIQDIKDILHKEYSLDEIYRSKSYSYYQDDPEDMPPIDEGGYNIVDASVSNNNFDTISIDHTRKVLIRIDIDSIYIYSIDKIPEELSVKIEKLHDEGVKIRNKSSVHILSHTTDRGMYLSDFKVNDKYENLDVKMNYNDDFESVHNKILKELDSDRIGLYLLHGTYGTGKTTYIRHLIRKIDKRVIFVSPSMADQFSSPEMIPFLMRYPNSIIVIEDAENIIKTREAGGNQSVSNLLNLSDGILGDCLRFQIICTFNTNKSEIDKALSRPGRLIESYEFDKLSLDKTNNLLENLGHGESDAALRLSDIYNPEGNHFEMNEKAVGFRQ